MRTGLFAVAPLLVFLTVMAASPAGAANSDISRNTNIYEAIGMMRLRELKRYAYRKREPNFPIKCNNLSSENCIDLFNKFLSKVIISQDRDISYSNCSQTSLRNCVAINLREDVCEIAVNVFGEGRSDVSRIKSIELSVGCMTIDPPPMAYQNRQLRGFRLHLP